MPLRYGCKGCDFIAKESAVAKEHYSICYPVGSMWHEETAQERVCDLCGVGFVTNKQFFDHWTMAHRTEHYTSFDFKLEIGKFSCIICDKEFESTGLLIGHLIEEPGFIPTCSVNPLFIRPLVPIREVTLEADGTVSSDQIISRVLDEFYVFKDKQELSSMKENAKEVRTPGPLSRRSKQDNAEYFEFRDAEMRLTSGGEEDDEASNHELAPGMVYCDDTEGFNFGDEEMQLVDITSGGEKDDEASNHELAPGMVYCDDTEGFNFGDEEMQLVDITSGGEEEEDETSRQALGPEMVDIEDFGFDEEEMQLANVDFGGGDHVEEDASHGSHCLEDQDPLLDENQLPLTDIQSESTVMPKRADYPAVKIEEKDSEVFVSDVFTSVIRMEEEDDDNTSESDSGRGWHLGEMDDDQAPDDHVYEIETLRLIDSEIEETDQLEPPGQGDLHAMDEMDDEEYINYILTYHGIYAKKVRSGNQYFCHRCKQTFTRDVLSEHFKCDVLSDDSDEDPDYKPHIDVQNSTDRAEGTTVRRCSLRIQNKLKN